MCMWGGPEWPSVDRTRLSCAWLAGWGAGWLADAQRASKSTGSPAVGYVLCGLVVWQLRAPRKTGDPVVGYVLSCLLLRGPEKPRETREAQRGPERPREAQRATEAQRLTERPREAQRGPERPRYSCMYVCRQALRGRAWTEQACHALGWLAGGLAGWLAGPRKPRRTLGLQLSGIVWFLCLSISGLEGQWGSSCRVLCGLMCLATWGPWAPLGLQLSFR